MGDCGCNICDRCNSYILMSTASIFRPVMNCEAGDGANDGIPMRYIPPPQRRRINAQMAPRVNTSNPVTSITRPNASSITRPNASSVASSIPINEPNASSVASISINEPNASSVASIPINAPHDDDIRRRCLCSKHDCDLCNMDRKYGLKALPQPR